ncbi:MAG: AMP phosphorylase [Candidatus Saliniplasma sp.]
MLELKGKKIDIEAGEHTVILNNKDAKRLGVRSQSRVRIDNKGNSTGAIVETSDTMVKEGEIGLLENVFKEVSAKEDDILKIVTAGRPESIEHIKEKLEGKELSEHAIKEIIQDITDQRLSDIELSAYVCGVYSNGMTNKEIKNLILAMIETGDTIEFDKNPVFDHHSIGGVPGNKITLLIVPIVAAAGMMIPKTSSRAISSAGGTADIFEVLADVTLSTDEIKRIAEDVGGTIAWGGGVNLAPSDDIIIRAEYPLRIDPYPQVLASVLSKKKATGADYLVMDIPVGPNTKVEDMDMGRKYARDFVSLGEDIGIRVRCALSYGGQPVGAAVGPAVEAKEALMALEGKEVPTSLIEKSTALAGMVLEQGGIREGKGKEEAKRILESGEALTKMKEIIEAQGGDPDVTSEDVHLGKHTKDILATDEGYVGSIHNGDIIQIVRSAGAPHDKGAGLILNKKKGDKVEVDDVLFTIYSDHGKKLKEAVKLSKHLNPINIEGMILECHPELKTVG